MPASDYGWMLTENKPLFQVYGTKRKHDGTGCDNGSMENNTENELAAKRRCVASVSQCSDETTNMEEINHNSTLSQNLNTVNTHTQFQNLATLNHHMTPVQQQQQTFACQDSHLQQSSFQVTASGDHLHMPGGDQMHMPSIETSLNTQHQTIHDQSMMIMDLHDETYSTTDVDINEGNAACIMMDSDYVPNHQQYKTNVSPSSGSGVTCLSNLRVKTFCRPSWEGLMDMGPYVSDYY